ERLPLDVLHRDERTAVFLTHVEDPHDVRVGEPRRQPGLAEKAPLEVLVPGKVLGQPLQRHRPVELDVVREVDRSHRAVPERTNELVAPGDACRGAHPSYPWSWPLSWPGGFGFDFGSSGGLGFSGGAGLVTTGVHVMWRTSEPTPMASGERRRRGSLCSFAITSARSEFARRSARQSLPPDATVAMADAC